MASYQVQRVKFVEFERNNLEKPVQLKTVFRGSWSACLDYWTSYASGMCDDRGIGANQLHSTGYFYRIIKEIPGTK